MRDLIQKASDTDKRITLTLLRSIWLSYLLSIGSTSTGVLSIFSVALLLGIQPAQANLSEQSASLQDRTVEEEPTLHTSSPSIEQDGERAKEENLTPQPLSHRPGADFSWHLLDEGDEEDRGDEEDKLTSSPSSLLEPAPVPSAIAPKPPVVATVQHSVEPHLPEELVRAAFTTPIPTALVPKPPVEVAVQSAVEHHLPWQLAVADEPTPATAIVPKLSVEAPTPNAVESVLVAQSQENASDLIPQNAPPRNEALTPTLDLQGVYLQQEDASARVRLRGIYPVSPNALFGAVVDLATGSDFAGTEGSGLNLSELYFAGSLPNYPNLRLVAGLMDLTSYFDRNSFAKDSTTHFFHPLFLTNPALAAAGIGSRPGALLNWNITDNVEAKAAVFSSERNLGDFALDAFAGEIGFRAGNGIVRATYATNKDTGRDGVFGTREGDRENAFGINGEYFIPEIKMGLFARYGRIFNRDRDDNSETYNFGLNFLDLFMRDDRLGLGYAFGRGFSKDNDVWELFYDVRVARNLRAGVTLQEREGFSETVFGFRVKTDLQLYP